ncbi:L-threonylcarbamoyladenylate synthase [Chitinophaga skermanii]|uniref:L-threonylcarbamoyladenylate synthase n=1 Tax=Chitinophaga skermanii TaxID=331697 RepID=A0A327QNF5_9BACT|nr:L-threonylcarbamoyladenylate synthase [Chitinophaga skermanii]RAJ05224.1 L-threonylcarbamoyladenylate synthase [Chitinophaga skermanii]
MDFEQDIVNCLASLRNGGNILYPTDTIWGIGCDATNEEAVKKIYQLKNRDEKKSLVILMADLRELSQYIVAPYPELADILSRFNKPTTVIYEGAINLASNVINEDGSIAIRIVKDEFCKHLVKRLRKPLVSTSANISGRPSPANFTEVAPEIVNGVDYVVKYRQNDLAQQVASTIVKINNEGELTVIRP